MLTFSRLSVWPVQKQSTMSTQKHTSTMMSTTWGVRCELRRARLLGGQPHLDGLRHAGCVDERAGGVHLLALLVHHEGNGVGHHHRVVQQLYDRVSWW